MRRLALLVLLAAGLFGQDVKYRPDGEVFQGPPTPQDFTSWLEDLQHWRAEKRIRSGFDTREYERPEFRWTQRNFIQPQMMVEDRYFYDPVAGRYTVDRYLDDLEKRYGGIDSVLIWAVYPNIGIDSRSQFDLVRDLPGGVEGVRQMVADFHRRGVRVFFPTMPWDQGTRDEGLPFAEAAARLMADLHADGINGDTFTGIPFSFREASDATRHPVVLEPEVAMESDEMVRWNIQSWGYWGYNFIPTVSRYKWLEPRHMVNICRRWARDHTDDLQHAFFNGVGFESWENIWGIWNGLTPRDAEALRRMSTVERQFAEFLVSPEWEPHTSTLQYGVYASRFPTAGRTLWTVVNRNEYPVAGEQLAVPVSDGVRWFDVWNGKELRPENGRLSFPVEAQGFGAILAAPAADEAFLARMSKLAAVPLATLSREWRSIPQTLVEIAATKPSREVPAGMVPIPAGEFEFEVHGVEIEGGNSDGVDVQYPWEPSARRHHHRRMSMKSFFMDRTPVTNQQFAAFLNASGYRPKDGHNFLREWKNGSYPAGWQDKPVTWVSLEDARAYARWAGKRLPHEWEWQYAAQGSDGRAYPWGAQWEPERVPPVDRGRSMGPPPDTGHNPSGASPFGVLDATGAVWQWTDEYIDDHTRAGIVRGGSYYQPQGSHWYFPQAYKLTEHGKYLLMSDGKDRSGGVGFRCVVDRD
jgi:formylglycine-generating enzyme required for sulfatase activity